MILFKESHVPMILDETKTETRRRWKTARVRVGKTYQAKTKLFGEPFAMLKITGLREERLGDITTEGIKAEGYNSLAGFKKVWIEINRVWSPDETVWVVQFQLAKKVDA